MEEGRSVYFAARNKQIHGMKRRKKRLVSNKFNRLPSGIYDSPSRDALRDQDFLWPVCIIAKVLPWSGSPNPLSLLPFLTFYFVARETGGRRAIPCRPHPWPPYMPRHAVVYSGIMVNTVSNKTRRGKERSKKIKKSKKNLGSRQCIRIDEGGLWFIKFRG